GGRDGEPCVDSGTGTTGLGSVASSIRCGWAEPGDGHHRMHVTATPAAASALTLKATRRPRRLGRGRRVITSSGNAAPPQGNGEDGDAQSTGQRNAGCCVEAAAGWRRYQSGRAG